MQIASRAYDIVLFRMGDLLEAKLVTQDLGLGLGYEREQKPTFWRRNQFQECPQQW
jgi:hypothetical protein